MKNTNQNGKTKQSKKSKEASIKLIIAACLFPFVMAFFSVIGITIFLLIMALIPQKGIPLEKKNL
ncbi:MAG: hypothetical protein IJA32_15235 [Lachnospiraceae bacterium]|nr:hypothetical protein [Lachnospiraceae bacterium]